MKVDVIENSLSLQSQLVELLMDCVGGGAAIGFLPPLSMEEAKDYWTEVQRDVDNGTRKLLTIQDQGRVLGAVQISLPQKTNGLHRADVEKLMVHQMARGKGLGRSLMVELEVLANSLSRNLLVLDTRKGDVASQLYRSLGYKEVGSIPDYARSADGSFHDTVIFYKLL